MKTFLSFDSSTQGLKAIIIEPEQGKILVSENVNYTRDLPEYKCREGVLEHCDPLIKHSDPLMWVAALDKLLEKMQKEHSELLSTVIGISGSGQQHGSVYLNNRFEQILASLNPRKDLASQIEPALARRTAPIWMDSSTTEECREITGSVGSEKIIKTGSPATERFTGPQIRKFFKDSPDAYANTTTIHLVSSFMASVLIGKNSPIDYGDGAGMNLLNLETLKWDADIAEATAPNLLPNNGCPGKLPPVMPSNTIAGGIHPYFEKYGLKPGTPVLIWSGDNPNSLIGVGAGASGIAVISLGTSDTVFAAMDKFHTDKEGYGHVFGNPAGGFMSLICFKNGSLARERIKEECKVDWEYFGSVAFENTHPGNNGNFVIAYFFPEITPKILRPQLFLMGEDVCAADRCAADIKIRGIVESQVLSMKLHSRWIGNFSVIRVTGGASANQGICQVIADVFNADIEKISVPDSAALGAAMRAANAIGNYPWSCLYEKFTVPVEKIKPDAKSVQIYEKQLKTFEEIERMLVRCNTEIGIS